MSLEILREYNYNSKTNNKGTKEIKSKDKNIKDKNTKEIKQITDKEQVEPQQQYKEFCEMYNNKKILPLYNDLMPILKSSLKPKPCILIDKRFINQMSNSEVHEKYKNMLEDIEKMEEQVIKWYKNFDVELVAHGWIIDKDGNMSGWAITRTKQKKKKYTYYDKEKLEKLRKEKKEKEKRLKEKEEKKYLEKKRLEKEEKKKRLKKEEQKKRASASQLKNASRYNTKKLEILNNTILNKLT